MKLRYATLFLGLTTLLAVPLTLAQDLSQLTGYWAMKPSTNGKANVAYFDGKGKSILYPFTCDFNTNSAHANEAPEESAYEISNDMITLSYPKLSQDFTQKLTIKHLEKDRLTLEQKITPESIVTFDYQRVEGVQHLCPISS